MDICQKMVAALGRSCVSLIFILFGIATFFQWDAAEADLASALSSWELYISHTEWMCSFFGILCSSVFILVILGVLLQIVGGLMLFFSYRVRLGSLLLLCYLLPSTILYHHFWFLDGLVMNRSLALFLKNLAIIGALLIIMAMGKGGCRTRVGRHSHSSHEEADECE